MTLLVAFLIGVFIGLLARPLLTTYLSWKLAQYYASMDPVAPADDRATQPYDFPR